MRTHSPAYRFGLIVLIASWTLPGSANVLRLAPARESSEYQYLQQGLTSAMWFGVSAERQTRYLNFLSYELRRALDSFTETSPNQYTIDKPLQHCREIHDLFGNGFSLTDSVRSQLTRLLDLISSSQRREIRALDVSAARSLLERSEGNLSPSVRLTSFFRRYRGEVPAWSTDEAVQGHFNSVLADLLTTAEGTIRSTNGDIRSTLRELSDFADASRSAFGYQFQVSQPNARRLHQIIDHVKASETHLAALSDNLLTFGLIPFTFEARNPFPTDREAPSLSIIEVPTEITAGQIASLVFETVDDVSGFSTNPPPFYTMLKWHAPRDENNLLATEVRLGPWESVEGRVRHVSGNRFAFEFRVPAFLRPGVYRWNYFTVIDRVGRRNRIEFDEGVYRRHWEGRSDVLEVARDVGVAGAVITANLKNASPDLHPPSVNGFVVANQQLLNGESQEIVLEVQDDLSGIDPKLPYCWGFERIELKGERIEKKKGWIHGCQGQQLTPGANGRWTSRFTIDRWIPPGLYQLARFAIQDRAENITLARADNATGELVFRGTERRMSPLRFTVLPSPAFRADNKPPRAYAIEVRETMDTVAGGTLFVKFIDDNSGYRSSGWCGTAGSLTTPYGWWTDSLSICGNQLPVGGWDRVSISAGPVASGTYFPYRFHASDNAGNDTDIKAVTAARLYVLGYRFDDAKRE